tara:strand:+ start:242 stop:460 length:219 start_codon:yes stop_codon:yes gene_type:complete
VEAEAVAEVESKELLKSLWEMGGMAVAEMEEFGRLIPMQQDAQQKEQLILAEVVAGVHLILLHLQVEQAVQA